MEKIVCGGNYTTNLIKDNINELIDESALVKGDVTSLQSDVVTLETDLGTLQTDVTTLQTDSTSLRTDVTALQTDSTSLRTDVDGLIDAVDYGNSIVIWGDSITDQNDGEAVGVKNTLNAGYFTVSNIMLGDYFNLLNNAGVSGERTDQILARFDAGVKAYSPKWVFILAGANDLLGSVPVSTIKDNLALIYDAIESIGAKVITATQYASASFTNESDFSEMNQFIRSESESRGFYLADFEAATTDPEKASFPYTYDNITYDGLHLNAYGAKLCANVIYDELVKFTNRTRLLPTKSNAKNKTLNPLNTGTSGTLNNGVTGQAPNDWNVFSTIPVGSTVVSSVEQGTFSNVLKLTYSGTDSFVTFSRVASSAPVNGKSYYAIAEVKCSLTNSNEVSLKLRSTGGSATLTVHGNRTYSDNAQLPLMEFDGVIKTPVLANVDGTTLIVDVFANGASGTVEIGRVGIFEL